MKLFGLFNKEKPVAFPQFRDTVRLAVRRQFPGVQLEITESGFVISMEDTPVACNLRNLYAEYCKAPETRDALIQNWLKSLIFDVPQQSWLEARMTLRPTLKDAHYLKRAAASMARSREPDTLPSLPFVGELSAIVMRDLSGSVIGVTRSQLDAWGVSFEQALQEAMSNMEMLNFPPVTNTMRAGGLQRKGSEEGEVVGLLLQGDHLTATWLLSERFRDHLSLRLQGSYVVAVPNRHRLTAVRADEPGLITTLLQSNRNYFNMPYPLTGQCYLVNAAKTGGEVVIYAQEALGSGLTGGIASREVTAASPGPGAGTPHRMGDLNGDWGLAESTDIPRMAPPETFRGSG